MKINSGGGLTSNKLVQPGQKLGPNSTNKINPKGVSQLGSAMDPRGVERIPAGTMSQVPLGNTLSNNVGAGGATGRTVQRCGSQGQHGEVAGTRPAPTPDILSEFGPEISRRSK